MESNILEKLCLFGLSFKLSVWILLRIKQSMGILDKPFHRCKSVNDEGFTYLGEGLKKLTGLKSVSLNFYL